MTRLLRSAFVIGRRDFQATVLSKAFIFFLLGPVFPLLLGGVFGGIGAKVASQTEQPVVAVVWPQEDYARLSDARDQLAEAMHGATVVKLVHYAPASDLKAQQQRLLASREPPVRAVLTGNLATPHFTGAVGPDVDQVELIIANARDRNAEPDLAVTPTAAASGSVAKDQAVTGQIGQMLLFFLTILLSGMVMSQLIRRNRTRSSR